MTRQIIFRFLFSFALITAPTSFSSAEPSSKNDNTAGKLLATAYKEEFESTTERLKYEIKYGMSEKEAKAYQIYKKYRSLRGEVQKKRKDAREERGEGEDNIYYEHKSIGSYQYKRDTGLNVRQKNKEAEDAHPKSRELIKKWEESGYSKVYGKLQDSDRYPVYKTDPARTRSDIVEQALLQKRFDPEDQKRLNWLKTRPQSILKAINDLPPDSMVNAKLPPHLREITIKQDLQQQWKDGAFRLIDRQLKEFEESGLAAVQKDESGKFINYSLDYVKVWGLPKTTPNPPWRKKSAKPAATNTQKKSQTKGTISQQLTPGTTSPHQTVTSQPASKDTDNTELKGWVEDSEGKIELFHTKDSSGRLKQVTEIDYDKEGKVEGGREYNPLEDAGMGIQAEEKSEDEAAKFIQQYQKQSGADLYPDKTTGNVGGGETTMKQSDSYTSGAIGGSKVKKKDPRKKKEDKEKGDDDSDQKDSSKTLTKKKKKPSGKKVHSKTPSEPTKKRSRGKHTWTIEKIK